MVEQQAEMPVGCRFESGTASLIFFEKGEYVWKSKS